MNNNYDHPQGSKPQTDRFPWKHLKRLLGINKENPNLSVAQPREEIIEIESTPFSYQQYQHLSREQLSQQNREVFTSKGYTILEGLSISQTLTSESGLALHSNYKREGTEWMNRRGMPVEINPFEENLLASKLDEKGVGITTDLRDRIMGRYLELRYETKKAAELTESDSQFAQNNTDVIGLLWDAVLAREIDLPAVPLYDQPSYNTPSEIREKQIGIQHGLAVARGLAQALPSANLLR